MAGFSLSSACPFGGAAQRPSLPAASCPSLPAAPCPTDGKSGSCGPVCPRQTGQVGSPANGDRPKPVPLRRGPEASAENTHSNVKRSAWTSSTTTSATTAIDTPCAQGLPRTASPKTEKTAAHAAVSISSHRMEYCGISICVDRVRRKGLSRNELEYSFAGRSVPTADWGVPCAAGQPPSVPYVSLANTPAADHPSRRAVIPGQVGRGPAAPAPRNCRAISSPIPRVPPVTGMCLSASLGSMCKNSLFRCSPQPARPCRCGPRRPTSRHARL